MPIHTTAMSQHRCFWTHLITTPVPALAPAPPRVGKGKLVYMPALSQLGHMVGWACLSACLPHPSNAMWWHEHTFAHLLRFSTATRQQLPGKPISVTSVSWQCHMACKHACSHACRGNTIMCYHVWAHLFTCLLFHNAQFPWQQRHACLHTCCVPSELWGGSTMPVYTCHVPVTPHTEQACLWCRPSNTTWQWGTPVLAPVMLQHHHLVVCAPAMSQCPKCWCCGHACSHLSCLNTKNMVQHADPFTRPVQLQAAARACPRSHPPHPRNAMGWQEHTFCACLTCPATAKWQDRHTCSRACCVPVMSCWGVGTPVCTPVCTSAVSNAAAW